MSKKIVISFPGARGSEIPLLYFGAKHFEDSGYEKLFINHPISEETSLDVLMDVAFENATKMIQNINLHEYDQVVFVAKSLGSVVACRIKEAFRIPASLILFTPLEETLPYIKSDNDILLIAAGDNDRYLDTHILKNICEKENIPYYIEPGVGHRMEVKNDLVRNLQILSNVIGRLNSPSQPFQLIHGGTHDL